MNLFIRYRFGCCNAVMLSVVFCVMTCLTDGQETRDLSPYQQVKKFFGIEHGAISEHDTQLLIRHILYRVKCDKVGANCLKCLEIGSVFNYLNKSEEKTLDQDSFQTLSMVLVVFMEDVKSECAQSLRLITKSRLQQRLTNNQPTLELVSILKILTQIRNQYRFGTLVLDKNGELLEDQSEVVDFDTDFNCFSPESLYEDLGTPMGSALSGQQIAAFTGLVVINVLKGRCIGLNNKPSPYKFMADLMITFANRTTYMFDHEEFENLLEALNIGKTGQSEVYQPIIPQQNPLVPFLNHSELLEEEKLLQTITLSYLGPCLLRNCYSRDELKRIVEANMSRIYHPLDLREECPDLVSAILAPVGQPTENNYNTSVSHTETNNISNTNLTIPEAYGYGALVTAAVSTIPLLAVLFLIMLGSSVKGHILCFLISLGVSSLTAEAVLHRIRQVIGLNRDGGGFPDGLPLNTSLFKMATILVGFYAFILLQMILNLMYGHQDYQVKKRRLVIWPNDKQVYKGGDKRNNNVLITMVILGDLLHNFLDGLVIGVSFRSGISVGLSTSLALLPQELTHELGDIATLIVCGLTNWRIIFMILGSGVAAFFGLMVGVPLASSPDWTDWMFAVFAGIFLFVALVNLVPELMYQLRVSNQTLITFTFINIGLLLGYSIMFLVVMFEGHIQV